MSVLVAQWRMAEPPDRDLTVRNDSARGIVAWATAHPEGGVYEADRTYPGPRILKFDEHLDRLEASARREGFFLEVNRVRFRSVLRALTTRAVQEGIPGGPGPSDQLSVRFLVRAPESRPGELDIVLEPFCPPARELYENGVHCATMAGARRDNPEAKTSGWMKEREEYSLPEGTYEGLLVSEADEILEGATSNFYALLDGELRTAEHGVLLGIARQIVLAVAPGIVPVRRDPIRRADLSRVTEAFLTSSSRAVVPINRIDENELGKRGPATDSIAAAYDAWVESHLLPL